MPMSAPGAFSRPCPGPPWIAPRLEGIEDQLHPSGRRRRRRPRRRCRAARRWPCPSRRSWRTLSRSLASVASTSASGDATRPLRAASATGSGPRSGHSQPVVRRRHHLEVSDGDPRDKLLARVFSSPSAGRWGTPPNRCQRGVHAVTTLGILSPTGARWWLHASHTQNGCMNPAQLPGRRHPLGGRCRRPSPARLHSLLDLLDDG
jgi:hypothetical protein